MSLQVQVTWSRQAFSLAVDLTLPSEGVTAIFGRSGCGKTSLLRVIAGLDRIPNAHVALNGECWQGRDFVPLHRRRIGLVFQEASLLAHLSVRDNLLYGYHRTPPSLRRLRLEQVSDMLGLSSLLHRSVDQLSGGQQQRVALGRALLSHPQLMLLDEPLAALDSQTKAEIMPFLSRLANESGVPMLLVTHSALEVEQLADRVLFMENGRVRSVEPLQAALSRPDSPLFLDRGPASILLGSMGDVDQHQRRQFVSGPVTLWLPSHASRTTETQRLRIAARDVSIALVRLEQVSVQNQLPASIAAIHSYEDHVLLTLQLHDGQTLLAEISHYAHQTLELTVGMSVVALVKSIALLR